MTTSAAKTMAAARSDLLSRRQVLQAEIYEIDALLRQFRIFCTANIAAPPRAIAKKVPRTGISRDVLRALTSEPVAPRELNARLIAAGVGATNPERVRSALDYFVKHGKAARQALPDGRLGFCLPTVNAVTESPTAVTPGASDTDYANSIISEVLP